MVSCVIIAKNEERNIARCIESILKETALIPEREIMLVDSCSRDKTIEIAKAYAIQIISLRPDWLHSPAAGRFSGINNTGNEFILCIDGDMELRPGWMNVAIRFLQTNQNVAGVQGQHYYVYYQNGSLSSPQPAKVTDHGTAIKKIPYLTESFVLRRKHIIAAGNFQPFLRAGEESELSFRLREKGYELYYLPHEAIYHYRKPTDTVEETQRRLKNGLFAGLGDLVAWSLQKHYFLLIKRFIRFFLVMALTVGISIFFLFSIVIKNWLLACAALAAALICITIQMIRKKSIYAGLVSTANIFFLSLSLSQGLFRKINDIPAYPTDIVWIKKF